MAAAAAPSKLSQKKPSSIPEASKHQPTIQTRTHTHAPFPKKHKTQTNTTTNRAAFWRHFADYFPCRLHKTADLPPDDRYVFVAHPHGIVSAFCWPVFDTNATGFAEKFPGEAAAGGGMPDFWGPFFCFLRPLVRLPPRPPRRPARSGIQRLSSPYPRKRQPKQTKRPPPPPTNQNNNNKRKASTSTR